MPKMRINPPKSWRIIAHSRPIWNPAESRPYTLMRIVPTHWKIVTSTVNATETTESSKPISPDASPNGSQTEPS